MGRRFPNSHSFWMCPPKLGSPVPRAGAGRTPLIASSLKSTEFHEALRQAYRALAIEEPQRCIVVDGRAPRDEVSGRIWSIVQGRLHPERVGSAETTAP